MFKKGLPLITLLFIAFIQATILTRIKVCNVQPDLLLLTVIFFALLAKRKDKINPLVFALSAGLLKDIFSSNILGVNASSFTILALVIERYRQKIYNEHLVSYFLVTLFSSLFVSLFYYFVSIRALPPFLNSLYLIILPFSIYTALFSIPYFYLLRKLCVSKPSFSQF